MDFGNIPQAVRNWQARNRARQELQRLSDRDLAGHRGHAEYHRRGGGRRDQAPLQAGASTSVGNRGAEAGPRAGLGPTPGTGPSSTQPRRFAILAGRARPGPGRSFMPTVLQVLPSLAGGGGVERGTLDISRALVAAGWRSLIVTGEEADRKQATAAGAHHAALPVARRNPMQAPGAIRHLASLIAEEGADLVHARSRWPAWLSYYAARRTGRPFVTTLPRRLFHRLAWEAPL